MRTLLRTLSILLLAPAAAALADDAPATASAKPAEAASPHAFSKMAYGFVKSTLLRSAEKMPEENYGFKPVETVRSFGQVVGHVADSQYFFCSRVLGEKNPGLQIEKTKTTKADLIAALKGAFAYCDKAYDGLTEAAGSEMVKFMKEDMSKRDMLTANAMHGVEHYGNMVVYLRMKGLVPPSSEQAVAPEPKK